MTGSRHVAYLEENRNEYVDLAGIPEENRLLGRRRHTLEFIFMI
jgi:hypothetical protein